MLEDLAADREARTRDGEVAAHGSDRHPHAEREMREARESLGVAVEEHPAERDRGERETERVEHPRGADEDRGCGDHGERRLAHAHRAARELARGSARIERIDVAIGDAVESHRCESSGGEGDGDPDDVEEFYLLDITGDRNSNQRKR